MQLPWDEVPSNLRPYRLITDLVRRVIYVTTVNMHVEAGAGAQRRTMLREELCNQFQGRNLILSSAHRSTENSPAHDSGLPLGLTLRTRDRERFLELFQPAEEIDVAAKAKIYLHVLRADTGDFDLQPLFDSVVDSSISYALSRSAAKKYYEDPRASTITKVRSKFRFPELKSGEGGEVLLYSFLECHLNAPKLLSKLELKTSGDDYVKAADGVHFRRSGPSTVEIIFGESKMHGDTTGKPGDSVRTAIYDAFLSMAKLRDDRFNTDKWLVEGNILKEAYDADTVDLLADLLVPTSGTNQSSRNSFGVFIGYEIDTTSWPSIDLEIDEIDQKINDTARSLVNARVEYIRDRITEHGLGSHDFHFYFVPFLKSNRKNTTFGVAQVRENLAKELSGKESRHEDE